MTQPEQPKKNLDFDQVELHPDTQIHASQPKPRRDSRPVKRAKPVLTIVLAVLLVGALAAGGYFFYELQEREAQLQQLRDDINLLNQAREAVSEDLEGKDTELKTATGDLEGMRGKLRQSREASQKLEKEKKDLIDEKQSLNAQLAKAGDRNKKLTDERDSLKNDLDARNRQLASVRGERDQARRQLQEREAEVTRLTKTNEDLSGRLSAAQQAARDEQDAWNRERSQLQSSIKRAEAERDRINKQFREESQASREIIKEISDLKQARDDAQTRNRQLEAEVAKLRDQVSSAERTTVGQLVPFSEELTPARISYREPLPSGVKIPRKLGQVVVMILISEVGAVERAFLLPNQDLEADLAAAVVRTIYSWKFTPPELRGTRVKTWQPVVVTAE